MSSRNHGLIKFVSKIKHKGRRRKGQGRGKGEGGRRGVQSGVVDAPEEEGVRKKLRILLAALRATFHRVCLCGRDAPVVIEMCVLLSYGVVQRGGCVVCRRVKPWKVNRVRMGAFFASRTLWRIAGS